MGPHYKGFSVENRFLNESERRRLGKMLNIALPYKPFHMKLGNILILFLLNLFESVPSRLQIISPKNAWKRMKLQPFIAVNYFRNTVRLYF